MTQTRKNDVNVTKLKYFRWQPPCVRGTLLGGCFMQASRVLLVAPTPQLSATLRAWLTDAGCAVMVATSFSSAKAQIKQGLSILISEVRLGDYNGLHLAIRAKSSDVPSIVLGPADAVLQREADALGVIYLTYG